MVRIHQAAFSPGVRRFNFGLLVLSAGPAAFRAAALKLESGDAVVPPYWLQDDGVTHGFVCYDLSPASR